MPLTCFLCRIVGHMEEQCVQFKGMNYDDLSKPYGRWFQNAVVGDNFHNNKVKDLGWIRHMDGL